MSSKLVRQAVVTRYAGPTNRQPARIIARADAGRKVVAWNHGLGIEANHRAAALALVKARGWDAWGGEWVMGAIGATYVHTWREPGDT